MSVTNVVSGTALPMDGMARQLSPPSSLIWIMPSSVPANSKPSCRGDSARLTMAPQIEVDRFLPTASTPQTRPIICSRLRSMPLVRSGLA